MVEVNITPPTRPTRRTAGATTPHRWAVWAHLALAVLGSIAVLPYLRYHRAAAAGVALVVVGVVAGRLYHPSDRIRNPRYVPVSMTEEGEGPKSPFWPSS